jgi:CRISPR-associated protein Cas1
MTSDPAADPRPPVDDQILYVVSQGTQVGVQENQYVVRDLRTDDSSDRAEGKDDRSNTLGKYPVQKIETINVFGRGVDVTSAVISTAADHDTAINFFTTHGRPKGHFRPYDSSVAVLHEQQHELDEASRHTIAKRFVLGKVVNAYRYLQRKDVTVDSDAPLVTAPHRIQTAASLDELRGIEGEAARQYFNLYDQTLASGWSMDGRSRRPPGDRVNGLLSLSYSFVQNECSAALRQANLDPYVGIFHQMRHGRPALALDLLEEFRRAFADPFVARLINREVINRDDFTEENHLSDSAFEQYVTKYDEYMSEQLSHQRLKRRLTRRETVRLQANLLRKRITGEIEEYPPFEVVR